MADIKDEHRREEDDRLDSSVHVDDDRRDERLDERLDDAPVEQDEVRPVFLGVD